MTKDETTLLKPTNVLHISVITYQVHPIQNLRWNYKSSTFISKLTNYQSEWEQKLTLHLLLNPIVTM